jgi:RNA polymerase-binding protein DksA
MAKALTKKQLGELKTLLREQEEKLLFDLERLGAIDKQGSGSFDLAFPDFGDKEDENTNEVEEFSNNLSVEHSLVKSLRDVRKALSRIDGEEYSGLCKYCGAEIGIERLKARPEATSCVACKTKLKGR